MQDDYYINKKVTDSRIVRVRLTSRARLSGLTPLLLMELSARLEKERERELKELKTVIKHTTIQKVEVCKSLLLTKAAVI